MSHCCDAPGLMPLDQALKTLHASVHCVVEPESEAITDALDRILADNIISTINVPSFDNSAMDGYALRAADLDQSKTLTLIGKSFAGSPFEGQIKAGQCVRIMTGAQMPDGADCVVMQENTRADHQIIHFLTTPKAQDNVRPLGNDIALGDCLLKKGRRLSPSDIGLLASLGLEQVSVYKPLKVALFSTGDELRLPGQSLEPGCIYDSNRFAVAAMLKRLGCAVKNLGIIADDPEQLRAAFIESAKDCHAVISSGGVSVGEADYTKDILDELGQINFWKLAIKPGKPFAFGRLNNQPENSNQPAFFGLPGNPVSAMVAFHQLALPCIQILSGERLTEPLQLSLPAQKTLKKRPGRTDFQRGQLSCDSKGNTALESTGDQSSGMLSSMSQANAYIILEQERGRVEPGEWVRVVPYDRWIG